jgi:hypothetical protein
MKISFSDMLAFTFLGGFRICSDPFWAERKQYCLTAIASRPQRQTESYATDPVLRHQQSRYQLRAIMVNGKILNQFHATGSVPILEVCLRQLP